MPLQNRVDPFGNLIRTTARGTIMGNRGGVLHNTVQEIVRQYAGRRWLTCLLQFRGRHREVMYPNLYTELFFLDEAVAFAAGHRPCAECRRDRFDTFRLAWRGANPQAKLPSAGEMDLILHPARIEKGKKVTYEAPLSTLPDGCFVQIEAHRPPDAAPTTRETANSPASGESVVRGSLDGAYLVLGDSLLLWTPEGYTRRDPRPTDAAVTVLTPAPIVDCFRQGYSPEIDRSAYR